MAEGGEAGATPNIGLRQLAEAKEKMAEAAGSAAGHDGRGLTATAPSRYL